MRRIVAILNPRSDRGRTADLATALRDALGSRFEVELLKTTRRGEGVCLATEAATRGCDAVLAVGGDGTVHEIANGLMALPPGQRPAMGVAPAGSGNDVAYGLGIGKGLPGLVEMIAAGHTRAVDVAEVRRPGAPAVYATNNVGALLEGVINHLSHEYVWPRGSGLYVRAMLRTLLRPIPVAHLALAIDGVEHQRSAVLLSIANGPRSGGKFFLMPEAVVGDGLLNYVTAAPVGRWRLLWKASRAMRGQSLSDPWIQRGTFRQMTIRSSIALAVHVDGEPWLRLEEDCRELSIDIRPAALRVICPRGDGCGAGELRG